MRHVLRFMRQGAAGLVVCLALGGPGAFAEDAPEPPITQIKLTETQIRNFIASRPELARVSAKLPASGEPDAATQAELEAIATKHGFANFGELDDVAANISLVMAGLDTETGEFTDPAEALAKELKDVKADASISEPDKKKLIDQLEKTSKAIPKVEYKENVDLVKAHRVEIEKGLP